MPTESESMTSVRTIEASPSEVYALLADPTRHHLTEPRDWVRDAIDPDPLTQVGQVFGMRMFLKAQGGDYEMFNRVTVLEPDRAIAWAPGFKDEHGGVLEGGHVWRYDLAPADSGTQVSLTYDWSQMPQAVRDDIPGGSMPPFPQKFLDISLAALDKALTGKDDAEKR